MRRKGRFWPFSVGDSVQQVNEVAFVYVVTQAGYFWKKVESFSDARIFLNEI